MGLEFVRVLKVIGKTNWKSIMIIQCTFPLRFVLEDLIDYCVCVLVWEIGGPGFDAYRYAPSEWNGQPHRSSLSKKENGRMRVAYREGSMVLPFSQDECSKTVS